MRDRITRNRIAGMGKIEHKSGGAGPHGAKQRKRRLTRKAAQRAPKGAPKP